MGAGLFYLKIFRVNKFSLSISIKLRLLECFHMTNRNLKIKL